VSDGSLVKVFDAPLQDRADKQLRWTTAGITYAQGSAGDTNIWSQPVDGGPPRQLTHFEHESIVQYDWSRDGRTLVFARGAANNDVILIANPVGRR
jgi:Tol biopolymer transport system component